MDLFSVCAGFRLAYLSSFSLTFSFNSCLRIIFFQRGLGCVPYDAHIHPLLAVETIPFRAPCKVSFSWYSEAGNTGDTKARSPFSGTDNQSRFKGLGLQESDLPFRWKGLYVSNSKSHPERFC